SLHFWFGARQKNDRLMWHVLFYQLAHCILAKLPGSKHTDGCFHWYLLSKHFFSHHGAGSDMGLAGRAGQFTGVVLLINWEYDLSYAICHCVSSNSTCICAVYGFLLHLPPAALSLLSSLPS